LNAPAHARQMINDRLEKYAAIVVWI